MATEDVVINIYEKGAKLAAKDIEELAAAADKASVTTDKLTGAVSGTFTTIDKGTGTVRKAVVENDRLVKATETVTKSTDQATAAFKRADNTGSVLSNTIRGLAGAFTALQVGRAVADVLRLVDSYGVATTTLRAYTQSTQEFNIASAALRNIATQQGASLTGLVAAYGELRTSTTFTRTSAETLTAALGSANALIRQTSPTAAAAAQGLATFTKALSDGRITGAEFSDILREQPVLANELARAAGLSAEAIKVLGLDANQATAALAANAEQIKKNVENKTSLIGAFDILKAKFTDFITSNESATGASQALAEIIKFVANNLETITLILGVVAGAWVAYRVAVVAATVATIAANAAISGGVIGTIVRLIALLGTAAAAWYAYHRATSAGNGASPSTPPTVNRDAEQSAARAAANREAFTRGSNATPSAPAPSGRPETGFGDIAGERATGGPVRKGSRYLVGEEGPELFIPGASGAIVPNGSGSAVNASNDNASPRRALTVLTDAFTAATKQPFAAVTDELRLINKTLESFKTAGISGSGGSVGSGGNPFSIDNLPGTSAINNFGSNDALSSAAAATAPTTSQQFAAAAAPASDPRASFALWLKTYEKALRDNKREMVTSTNAMLREKSDKKLRDVYNQIPSDIRDEVVAAAGAKVYGQANSATVAFRSGGGFTVPGSTGTDSKLVQMRVTPGEEIDVKTRKQRREEQNGANRTTQSIVLNFNVVTPDANSFRKSEKQISRDILTTLMKAAN